MQCKVISLLEKLCTAMSNPLLVHHCCRWKEEAGKPPKLSHLCCIDGKCGKDDQDPDESDDYDEPTCTLPKVSLTCVKEYMSLLVEYHLLIGEN